MEPIKITTYDFKFKLLFDNLKTVLANIIVILQIFIIWTKKRLCTLRVYNLYDLHIKKVHLYIVYRFSIRVLYTYISTVTITTGPKLNTFLYKSSISKRKNKKKTSCYHGLLGWFCHIDHALDSQISKLRSLGST